MKDKLIITVYERAERNTDFVSVQLSYKNVSEIVRVTPDTLDDLINMYKMCLSINKEDVEIVEQEVEL